MSAHGTVSRYTNDGCRCDACGEAQRTYMREYRARRMRLDPTFSPKHGRSLAGVDREAARLLAARRARRARPETTA